ncbi:hypothetical protein AKJ65_04035 [candidate division MSBL1 archaeon SCGC-AAA259E19]|uniref:Polysaccharide pyruvyl transferase domain-containing protein n=1 Tax=candidate division MSBL1 archaeon SCGC-AAA259E19 TaxID=1698264 RepID=A0A133UKD1_9EURY|nr:hypothetical protein AKJ65_04035 [candidate division MSBL1 archaeon SCGC-AAA259E19]
MLKAIVPRKEICIEDDLAFKLKPASSDGKQLLAKCGIQSEKGPVIGVNLRTLSKQLSFDIVHSMAQILDQLVEEFNCQFVFIPFGYGSVSERVFDDDRTIALQLKKFMKKAENLKIISEEHRPADILGLFPHLDAFIGMRFHSVIFSLITQTPVVSLIYDTKVKELIKKKHSQLILGTDLPCRDLKSQVLNSIRQILTNQLPAHEENS